MNLLPVGTKAPDFTVKDQNGNTVSLANYRGKKIILYFYPKDSTPGCTKEACGFRDHFQSLQNLNVEILGVSTDSEKSHKSFIQKQNLPFTLLADTDKQLVNSYGVWGEKTLYGKKYMGIHRITYLIDENGMVAAVFNKVKPETHAQELLNFLQEDKTV